MLKNHLFNRRAAATAAFRFIFYFSSFQYTITLGNLLVSHLFLKACSTRLSKQLFPLQKALFLTLSDGNFFQIFVGIKIPYPYPFFPVVYHYSEAFDGLYQNSHPFYPVVYHCSDVPLSLFWWFVPKFPPIFSPVVQFFSLLSNFCPPLLLHCCEEDVRKSRSSGEVQ